MMADNPQHGPSAMDCALVALKVGVSIVPGVGGPMSVILDEFLPNSTTRAVNAWRAELERQIAELGDRVDTSTVTPDQVAEIYKTAYLTALQTNQDEKLRAAAALVANALLKPADGDKLPFDELDLFARCVASISGGALRTLCELYRIAKGGNRDRLERIHFGRLHRTVGPQADPDLLLGLVRELDNWGLARQDGAPQVTEGIYNNWPIDLTPLGVRFVERLLKSNPDRPQDRPDC